MDRKIFLLSLPVLGILCSCQSEMIQESTKAGRVLTVKATLPGTDETRTHITYGNTSIDNELFRWDTTPANGGSAKSIDYIALANVTKLYQFKNNSGGIELDVTKIDGRSASFQSVQSVNKDIEIKAGDVLFVNYWDMSIRQINDAGDFDSRKIFTIYFGAEANKPQYIVEHPDDAYMSYMQGNLRMYDIVTVEQDDVIPDLHFKWLSSLIRVSLRNETGHDIYPTKLEVDYPGAECFFNTTLYCSVAEESSDNNGLLVYTDEEFYGDSEPYTDHISTTLNGKLGTQDAGASIKNGDTYDLYLSAIPKINNNVTGTEGLNIRLVEEHQTNAEMTYSINVSEFDKPIEAGKRYWFNLTAVEEDGVRKLMYTSEWLKDHPEKNPNVDEQSDPEN